MDVTVLGRLNRLVIGPYLSLHLYGLTEGTMNDPWARITWFHFPLISPPLSSSSRVPTCCLGTTPSGSFIYLLPSPPLPSAGFYSCSSRVLTPPLSRSSYPVLTFLPPLFSLLSCLPVLLSYSHVNLPDRLSLLSWPPILLPCPPFTLSSRASSPSSSPPRPPGRIWRRAPAGRRGCGAAGTRRRRSPRRGSPAARCRWSPPHGSPRTARSCCWAPPSCRPCRTAGSRSQVLKEIVPFRENVINFGITAFHCVIKNKHLSSFFCFILL